LEINQTLEFLYISFFNQTRDDNTITLSLFINKSLKCAMINDFIKPTQFNHLETDDEDILKKRKQYQKLLRLLNSRFLSDDVLSSTILI
jgi:hypothetical protein